MLWKNSVKIKNTVIGGINYSNGKYDDPLLSNSVKTRKLESASVFRKEIKQELESYQFSQTN